MLGILCFNNSDWRSFIHIQHLVSELWFFTMHNIAMQADFTIGKFHLLFHENTIFCPSLACDGFVDIAELYIFL